MFVFAEQLTIVMPNTSFVSLWPVTILDFDIICKDEIVKSNLSIFVSVSELLHTIGLSSQNVEAIFLPDMGASTIHDLIKILTFGKVIVSGTQERNLLEVCFEKDTILLVRFSVSKIINFQQFNQYKKSFHVNKFILILGYFGTRH